MGVVGIDHVALPIGNVDAMLTFYRALGFSIATQDHGDLRIYAANLGEQRINFHDPKTWQSTRFTLRGPTAEPGCGDLCFRWDGDVAAARAFVENLGHRIEEGPVPRDGGHASGSIVGTSVYLRDPDGNLVELLAYPSPAHDELSHTERIAVARAAIDYVTGRSSDENNQPVPNCPGWNVYNAAVHIGRVGVAWDEMIKCSPDDATARDRAYEVSGQRPHGVATSELKTWVGAAIDRIEDDPDEDCFFSMTGGPGTHGMWAWHVASELGVHRLDVEAALGHDNTITDREAVDAAVYATKFFLPAMRGVTGDDPGAVTAELVDRHGAVAAVATIDSDAPPSVRVTVRGPATQVLLALWGRPHTGVEVTSGDTAVLDRWRELPGKSFQFGTWD